MLLLRLRRLRRSDGAAAAVFLAPSVIGFSVFFLIPFAAGMYYSLVDSPVNGHFAGLANYREVLASSSFRRAARNTGWFVAVGVPVLMTFSLVLAIVLNRRLPLRRWLRTAYVMPLVIPVASVVMVWQVLFDRQGWINALMHAAAAAPVDWMQSGWARLIIVAAYVWKNAGYMMILYLAGLQSIPQEYYEAASIDGAGTVRKFRSVTLVYLTPTTVFVLMMSLMNVFKLFRETYLIAGDYPQSDIYQLQHYMNNQFQALDYQNLIAAAYVMAAAVALLAALLLRAERKFRDAVE
ncbi:carbohydrate ABC transporter permease [Paenibacillus glycinis]|uniref:ABC transporter permease subunit n=1 Tax=Paenibacillus glycinis TaxID=2697035 RepID=A0ABW9XYR2_9BACL|nr:sugar ABC transporter permease [Paenibacillus glycinis]NBD27868.1 ABC transporter permease subunit [Paenibacillus glycinis]